VNDHVEASAVRAQNMKSREPQSSGGFWPVGRDKVERSGTGVPERRNTMSEGSETGTPSQICSALWRRMISPGTWKELTLR